MNEPPDPTRGLYETLLVVRERPVALGRHLDRLERSAKERFGVAPPAALGDDAVAACAGIALGRLRIDIRFDASAPVWATAAVAIDPAEFFPAWEDGADLRTVVAADWSGAHKWADRRWIEDRERELDPAVPLFLGAEGAVLEAARANVFAVVDGALVTPPLDGRILPGTARAAILGLAAEIGVEADERTLTSAELTRSGEVFLTSSVRGVRPARSLDSELLPGHELTDRLAAALRSRWLAE